MKLTTEQRDAVVFQDSVYLTACPGSGKTRVVISKLARCLAENADGLRAVACITYTNAAVHEIEARVRQYIHVGDSAAADICTIHAFCLNHIFRRRHHDFPEYKSGFRLVTQDSEEFRELVELTRSRSGRSTTTRDIEAYAGLQIGVDGAPRGGSIDSGAVTPEDASFFWSEMRNRGQLDFASLLYLSFVLVKKHPGLTNYLASRFSWIIVDEFQDTTGLQANILLEVFKQGRTKFFLVGDEYQSIYDFAGADPKLAQRFATRIGAKTDFVLSGNFRSSRKVVVDAEKVFPRQPRMRAVGRFRGFAAETEYLSAASSIQAITGRFLPRLKEHGIALGDAAVLAPTWFKLLPIGRVLRERGIRVVGPGARPYRRAHMFATIAERLCGYLMEPDAEALQGIERALFDAVLQVRGRPLYEIFTYAGRVLVFRLVAEAKVLRDATKSGVDWLHRMAASTAAMLGNAGWLSLAEHSQLTASVNDMVREINANKVESGTLTVEDLGLFARPNRALKLLTLHGSKGREFGAVAMIDLHEGSIPNYRARTADEFLAAQRLFYVGVTRAEKYVLYVSDTSDYRNRPTRFLGQNFLNLA